MSILKGNNIESEQSSTVIISRSEPNFSKDKKKNSKSSAIHHVSKENVFTEEEDISKFLSLDNELGEESNFGGLIAAENQHYQDNVDQDEFIKQNKTGTMLEKLDKRPYLFSETKNIPKNFGKQLIKFVKKNRPLIEEILSKVYSPISYSLLNSELQSKKKSMSKIKNLRELWIPENPYGKEMRIISMTFFRKYSFSWIFNSRISDFKSHLKYRSILQRNISNPQLLVYLKREC